MLSRTLLKKQQGFAVLISVVLLCFAAIAFCTHLVSSQLIDNQIIGNYYRNKEAFINAESGVHFVISELENNATMPELLDDISSTGSFSHSDGENNYVVTVIEKTTDPSRLEITSNGTSADGSAKRQINVEVEILSEYPIPSAPLSVNGRLKLYNTASINDGCEGLTYGDCHARENIAAITVVKGSSTVEEKCTDTTTYADIMLNTAGKVVDIADVNFGDIKLTDDSPIDGLVASSAFTDSLFEDTFGAESMGGGRTNSGILDINGPDHCQNDVNNSNADIIFINGNCKVTNTNSITNKTSENKTFTIGSVEDPKLVFIKGGRFIKDDDEIEISVVGMLYFLPPNSGLSVDIGGVKVNGALLSEYGCTYNNSDDELKNRLSVRFDKLVLNKLYSDLGILGVPISYRLVAGTWRDFE